MERLKLYHVHSIVKDFEHRMGTFNDVPIHWIKIDDATTIEKAGVDYPGLIQDYEKVKAMVDNDYGYCIMAINESFTLEEAEELKGYLINMYNDEAIIEEVELPLDNNIMPICWTNEGRYSGSFHLAKEVGYSLPFKVSGYYDIYYKMYPEELPNLEDPSKVLPEIKYVDVDDDLPYIKLV